MKQLRKETSWLRRYFEVVAENSPLMAKAVYEKLRVNNEEFIVGGVGSVFSSRTLRESFMDNVRNYIPSARLVEPLVRYMPVK